MNRKPTRTPADPWEWFSGAIYHLTKSSLIKIWNTSERTIERWSATKSSVGEQSITKNPLVLLGVTLEKLMERGKVDFARAAVDYLARIVGCRLVSDDEDIAPDKKTIAEECLDDLPAVADFHMSMKDLEPVPVVRCHYRHAQRELREDMKLYEQQHAA